jgi:hypothetical protein
VRVRLVLGLALLAVAGALVLDASGSASRTAGSDHNGAVVFSATVPGGGEVCQPVAPPPNDTAQVQVLIGTNGGPVPDLSLRLLDAARREAAAGHLPAGAREGYVTIPLRRVRAAPAATRACLRIGGSSKVLLGGEGGPVSSTSEVVDGSQQPGRISLLYLRAGSETWWQLLPTLARRFGLGKASFFGAWTLPLAALLLLGVWVSAVRLLLRELT